MYTVVKIRILRAIYLSLEKTMILVFHGGTSHKNYVNFDILLTVHLGIFISVFNQLDAQNLFHNKFYYFAV